MAGHAKTLAQGSNATQHFGFGMLALCDPMRQVQAIIRECRKESVRDVLPRVWGRLAPEVTDVNVCRMSALRWFPGLLVSVCLFAACRRPVAPAATTGDGPGAPPAAGAAAVPAPAAVSHEALFQAALDGDLETVKRAVARREAATAVNQEGRTALMLAAFNGHTAAAVVLLDSGAPIDARDQTGRTALMYASSGENDATVAELLRRGAGVNLADNEEHWTPLMFAAAEGHGGVARLLLAAGADPTAADIDGEDSVMFAQSRGHPELAALLAEAKAKAPPAKPR